MTVLRHQAPPGALVTVRPYSGNKYAPGQGPALTAVADSSGWAVLTLPDPGSRNTYWTLTRPGASPVVIAVPRGRTMVDSTAVQLGTLDPTSDLVDTRQPPAQVSPADLAAAHDTDPERETFIPDRLSAQQLLATVQTALAVAHDTDTERETFVPARLSDAALRAALVSVGRTRSRLARWKRKLATSPATAKVAIVGDSTAEETNYPWPYSRLRTYWMQPGMALGGMQSANLIEGGNSGLSLQAWLAGSAVDFPPAALWAAAPDLVIFRFLTNDTRLGTRTQAQMTADVQTLLDLTTANLPNADIVLTVPPTLTTTVVGQDFLSGATLAQAQARTDAMRAAVLGFTDAYPHVLVLDSGGDVYGTRVGATSPLMTDQLHPNQTGQERWADYMAPVIGLDRTRPVDAPDSYRWQIVGRVSTGGNGYLDLDTLDTSGVRGKEWPLTATDLLYIPGFATYPLLLTGATFAASGNNVRVLKGGTDFTGVAANTMVVAVGNHPREGVTGGRTEVTIDPGSIAASSTLDVTATVTGAATQMGVVAQPPTNVSAGLMWQAWVTATDTVTIRFFNPTAGAIDPPSGIWKFWLAR